MYLLNKLIATSSSTSKIKISTIHNNYGINKGNQAFKKGTINNNFLMKNRNLNINNKNTNSNNLKNRLAYSSNKPICIFTYIYYIHE